ncbi:hypothetical protein NQ318_009090 [Aromia moschata]|uniref:Chitinase n=1 Tax=Aromia moschata TaxID=1265417 RepID=A0AAV8YUN7_9CUCU|nr:hypothetical protein NQ318_009090 [Aromia moschata]
MGNPATSKKYGRLPKLLVECVVPVTVMGGDYYTEKQFCWDRFCSMLSIFRCTLPSHPENGRWNLLNGDGQPGEQISFNSVIKYECDNGYKLTGVSQYKVCDKKWRGSIFPECERLCPPLYSTPQIALKCVDKRGTNISCLEATDGSYLSYTCADFYETPFGYKKTLLCLDGTWNYPKPVCQPVCGKKIDDDNTPLIFGGETKEVIEYPWVTAVYSKKNDEFLNVCGGTIISPRIVLTAAHCVTNAYGDVFPKENYRVGAGKLHNKYNDSRDPDAQHLEISRIIVHSGYKGENRRFQADIALLVTKGSFTLNEWVQPICFNDVNNIHLHAGYSGVVAGWGTKEDGLASDKLKTLEIPYKYETTCAQELPREWADKYAMIDKICAGFFNMSTAVCKGDSGGGLVFKNPEDNRYYIHGVVSIGPAEKGECNIQQNSLYTKVAFYYEFLDKEISKNSPADDCTLPAYPKNGKWVVQGANRKPGDIVPLNTMLKYSCNEGFRLSTGSPNIECNSPLSSITCIRPQKTINQTLESCRVCVRPCIFQNPRIIPAETRKPKKIDCADAVEGTTLTFTCPEGYRTPAGAGNVRQCKNRSWGSPAPGCLPAISVNPPMEGSPPKVFCSYASWRAYKGINPENFNATLCTHFIYSFVGLWPDGKLRIEDEPLDIAQGSRGLYFRVNALKNVNKDLKILLSVGGSGASNASLYSSMAGDPTKRAAFISSAIDLLRTYKFDGLDIEWHIPEISDKENYGTLLTEVSQQLKPLGWLVTASVRSDPDASGYDGPRMNEVLDWVIVKTYNMYGAWSRYTGQNSALYPSSKENEWERNHLNIEASAQRWLEKGVTKDKMILSVAFFGRSFTLSNANENGIHAPISGKGPGEDEGFLVYSEICEKYSGWKRVWDGEQRNPYKYSNKIWFGYDDEESIWIKAAYIKDNGYSGVNVWPVDGDDVHGKCGTKQILLRQVNTALGYNL